jgi:DNA-binding CsgD family transcriptional regulator
MDVVSSSHARQVRVSVLCADRLFADLLVSALNRRGMSAQVCRDDDTDVEPDVLLADERLVSPSQGGMSPGVLIVERDDRATRRFSRLLGARACVPGTSTTEQLATAVLRVALGENLLLSASCAGAEGFLTSREIDVLHLMAAGHDNAAIAEKLDISPHTARTHVQRILTKFEVSSRFSAVSAARGQGLLRSGT